MTCTVVGFPLGAMATKSKAAETTNAIKDGADEIDMVINIGKMLDAEYDYVREDIKAVVDAANGKTVKVIFETCLLSKEQIVKATELSVEAGAHFVKTSTGFSTGGATVEDVKIMSDTAAGRAEVKASGGVRSKEDFDKMVEAGATRIGTSSGVKLVNGEEINGGY
jgi:deoxyribose-phosphate aldolase